MEIPASAVTGAVRVGVQVASNQKRPLLEVYHELRNIFGPPYELGSPIGVKGDCTEKSVHRWQDVFIQFVLVNLGSVRAENVVMKLEGEFERSAPATPLGELELFNITIPQLAPGQAVFLFRLEEHDLYLYPEGGGKPLGYKNQTLAIEASYSGPFRGLNRLPRWWGKIRGRAQYKMSYSFDPRVVRTDYPAAEYNG